MTAHSKSFEKKVELSLTLYSHLFNNYIYIYIYIYLFVIEDDVVDFEKLL